jgi:hypothetical protein
MEIEKAQTHIIKILICGYGYNEREAVRIVQTKTNELLRQAIKTTQPNSIYILNGLNSFCYKLMEGGDAEELVREYCEKERETK